MAVNRSIGVLLLIAGTTLGGTAVAGAADPPPVSGDSRAVAHDGNAVTCAEAGLTGDIITVTSTVDGTNTYISITAIPADTTVTGVVVKGGPNYNVYLPGSLGALPWTGLHSPLVPSGAPAQISHWFVCGVEKPPTSTTTKTTTTTKSTTTTKATTTTTKPTTTTSGTTNTTATTTTTPSTVTTATTATTTTTKLAVATTGNQGSSNLAFTGFGNGWLIVLAAALLLGGLGIVLTPKLRTLLANRRR